MAARSRVRAVVAARRTDGDLTRLTLRSRELPAVRPGQRLSLLPPPGSAQLPRVEWGCASAPAEGGGAADVVLGSAPGAWQAEVLDEGDEVVVIAPLGRGFRLPSEPCEALLMGEGPTLAALVWVAELLRARGCRTTLLAVTASVDAVPALDAARRVVDDLVLASRDGSTSHGRPVEPEAVLAELLAETAAPLAYVGGEPARSGRWARACEDAGLTTQVALDTRVACGIGLCDACRIPVLGGDGRPVGVRLCAEGPVLPAGRVAWDLLEEVGW